MAPAEVHKVRCRRRAARLDKRFRAAAALPACPGDTGADPDDIEAEPADTGADPGIDNTEALERLPAVLPTNTRRIGRPATGTLFACSISFTVVQCDRGTSALTRYGN